MRPLWEVLGIRLGLVSDSANLSVSLTYNPRLSKKRKEKRLMRCVLGLGKKVLVGDDKVRERALAESDVAQAIPGSEGVGLLRCAW